MRPDRITLAAFVCFVLIAGAVSVAIRLGSFELPPFWAASLRFAVAVAMLFGLGMALRIPFPRGTNLAGALSMSVTYVVSTALSYVGVGASSASMGALAFALTPLATLVLAAAFSLERLTLRGLAGALIAVGGTVIVVSDQIDAAVEPPALLALGGAMLFAAITAVIIKRFPPGHPITANAVGGAFVLPLLLGMSLVAQESWALPAQPETWLSLGFLAVFGTVILFPLALFIIGRWTATGYSYAGLLKPLAGVALAAVILGEPIRLPFLVGALVVLLGVWLGAFRTGSLPSRSRAVVLPPTPTLEPAFADDRPR